MTHNFPQRPLPSPIPVRSVAVMDAEDIATGHRLKAARLAAGMKTRKELTDAAGLHRVGEKVLGMIERGQRKLQPHEAEAFAQALNIDARSFYDEPNGTQLDRVEQALVDLAQRDDEANEVREAILALLDRQSDVLRDIAGLLARQDSILEEIQRVVSGMPGDETLRLLAQAGITLRDANVQLPKAPDFLHPPDEGRQQTS